MVRSTLEPLAAKLAIERCTEEQLTMLKKNQKEAYEAAYRRDAAALARCDEEFHRTISMLSGNALLIEINEMISSQPLNFVRIRSKLKPISTILFLHMTPLFMRLKSMTLRLGKRKCAST